MAANNFKKFWFAKTPRSYQSITGGINDGDIAFVGGTAKENAGNKDATLIPAASGIYTQGYYYPTPYTKEALDQKESDIKDTISGISGRLTTAEGDIDVLEGSVSKINDTLTNLPNVYAKKDLSNVDNSQNIVYKVDGKIPSELLPSYVDDVKDLSGMIESGSLVVIGGDRVDEPDSIEYRYDSSTLVAIKDGKVYPAWTSTDVTKTMEAYGKAVGYESGGAIKTKVIPVTDKIYIDTSDNRVYRWSGSTMSEVSGCAISDAQATMLLNQYVKTLEDGTATAITNQAEIDVVTSKGTKTESTSKDGAKYTFTRSKAATKTYVDKMSPSVTEDAYRDLDSNTTDFVYSISKTNGSINTQANIKYMTGSFRGYTVTVNGTTKQVALASGTADSYTPNKAATLALTTQDFVTWEIL